MKRFFAAFLVFILLFSNVIALADDEIGENDIGGAEIIDELNELMQNEVPDFWFYENVDGETGVNLHVDENTTVGVPREDVELYAIVDISELTPVKQQQFRDGYAEAQAEGIIHYSFWLDLPDEYAHYVKEPPADSEPFVELYVTLHNGSVGEFKINGVPQELTKRDDMDDVYGIVARDLGTTVMTVQPSEGVGDFSAPASPETVETELILLESEFVSIEKRVAGSIPDVCHYNSAGGGTMAEICETVEQKADNFDDQNQENLIVLVPYSDILGTSIADAGTLPEEDKNAFLNAFKEALTSEENVVYCFWLDLGSGFADYINEEGSEEEPYLKLMLRLKGNVSEVTVNGKEIPFEAVEGSPDLYLVRFTEMGAVTVKTLDE